MLLVVANFSNEQKQADVVIPAHAFDFLQIPETETTATDLLSKEKLKLVLRRDNSVTMQLEPWGGRVYKLKF
jgi:hypothetical protein